MRLLIVIVNYKSADLVLDCLRSLEADVRSIGDTRVSLTDCLSPDDSVSRLRALRGATTVEVDTSEAIRARTAELVTTLLERNALAVDDIVSVVFTATGERTAQVSWRAPVDGGRLAFECRAEADGAGLFRDGQPMSVDVQMAAPAAKQEAR
jgi:hypothetical protein